MSQPKFVYSQEIRILNWNIGGAKYLELLSTQSPNFKPGNESREKFRERLNHALKREIEQHQPEVMTLQEVVEYEPRGYDKDRGSVIDPPADYHYFPFMLIDTIRHSHQGKWNKVREIGEWSESAFLAQGNAILVRKDLPLFPLWSLPALNQDHKRWVAGLPQNASGAPLGCMEVVALESGLYFGDRNTEPRAALVIHLVLSEVGGSELPKPLDVFVINLHLTTLMLEREGIPLIDEVASQTRLRQLNTVLNGIVSRYNEWRAQKFKMRGEHVEPMNKDGHKETYGRLPPIWIIAGDFNFTPESIEYATLDRRGFISMVDGRTKAKGLGNRPSLTVDYIFAGPRFEAIDPDAAQEFRENENRVDFNDETKVSDHFPLFASVPITVNLG
jgi:endonuclease/exonuclease/phosphatase family metal-dependent hydrolase